jgi:hypothetical protein
MVTAAAALGKVTRDAVLQEALHYLTLSVLKKVKEILCQAW